MKIQSLSVVVPNKKCVNDCAFCVSKMHTEDYKNQMDVNLPFYDLYQADYIKRLEFARDNGCNTVMLTGNSEPQMNRTFLKEFGNMNSRLSRPFRWIEMQTTGVAIDEPYLRFLRNHVGISTISISISSFNDYTNMCYIGANTKIYKPIDKLCESIKKYDFNLRLSLNLCDGFNDAIGNPETFFKKAKSLGANQITFRVLYSSGLDTPQDRWIKSYAWHKESIDEVNEYILAKGNPLERLPFGAMKYSVDGMSVVLDKDCMSMEEKEALKYLILRENCKLYSKWDDEGSLIF